MGDLVDVVEDGRLEIREEQVQMVKFQDKRERSQEEKNALMSFPLMVEVIAGQRHLKLKDNPDVGYTETAVSKAEETNKIREIYRAICEIPENGG